MQCNREHLLRVILLRLPASPVQIHPFATSHWYMFVCSSLVLFLLSLHSHASFIPPHHVFASVNFPNRKESICRAAFIGYACSIVRLVLLARINFQSRGVTFVNKYYLILLGTVMTFNYCVHSKIVSYLWPVRKII